MIAQNSQKQSGINLVGGTKRVDMESIHMPPWYMKAIHAQEIPTRRKLKSCLLCELEAIWAIIISPSDAHSDASNSNERSLQICFRQESDEKTLYNQRLEITTETLNHGNRSSKKHTETTETTNFPQQAINICSHTLRADKHISEG